MSQQNRKDNPLPVVNSCGHNPGNQRGCTVPPDRDLLAQGWQYRFIGDERMANDAVQTYGELGHEVLLLPVNTKDLKDECEGCKILFQNFKAVYTRKQNSESAKT